MLLFRAELNALPNRAELGRRTVPLHFQPVAIDAGSRGGIQVVGAWRLLVDDPRFGGLSALALAGGGFIGLSDSGVAVHFPKPGGRTASATLDELPGGPGAAGFKVNRDSEALVADRNGRGWWVAFENRNELWLYDKGFNRTLDSKPLNVSGLARNRGIEGMTNEGGESLLFPERGGLAVSSDSGQERRINGLFGWISDSVRLPDGRIFVVNRRPTPIGLSNVLVELAPDGSGYRAGAAWRIPVGRLDNVEGLAAEPVPGGGMRLWMVTDNNLQQRRPTLLIEAVLRPRPGRSGR